jgi:hypothetical protein
MLYDELLKAPPYAYDHEGKGPLLKAALADAFEHHFQSCSAYRKLCEKRSVHPPLGAFDYPDLPYLPVQIFKQRSSATTSQTPSTVVLDDVTRSRQVNTLIWLLKDFLGTQRRPFLIVDVDPKQAQPDQHTISARAAAIRGFLLAASSASYCMRSSDNGNLLLDIERLAQQLSQIQAENKRAVIMGYTYVLYVHAARQLLERGVRFSLGNATILHIGGWKRLQSEAVSKKEFNDTMQDVFGVPTPQILDAYGFTEQLGLIYVDCADGLKRCPTASEIVIRDPSTLEPVPDGDEGLVEFVTPLPHSYPGIAVILDDVGRIVTRDPSPCGRHGTAFEILGRAKESEIRGCGEILAAEMAQDP